MLNENRIALSSVRLEQAKEDLETASENLSAGRYKAANNRAYYAVFTAIRAVLALDAVDFKKHGSVINYFSKNYIRTGMVDEEFEMIVRVASKSRKRSDYEDYYKPAKEEVEDNIDGAGKLLAAIERLIELRLEVESVQECPELCSVQPDCEQAEESVEDEEDMEQ